MSENSIKFEEVTLEEALKMTSNTKQSKKKSPNYNLISFQNLENLIIL